MNEKDHALLAELLELIRKVLELQDRYLGLDHEAIAKHRERGPLPLADDMFREYVQVLRAARQARFDVDQWPNDGPGEHRLSARVTEYLDRIISLTDRIFRTGGGAMYEILRSPVGEFLVQTLQDKFRRVYAELEGQLLQDVVDRVRAKSVIFDPRPGRRGLEFFDGRVAELPAEPDRGVSGRQAAAGQATDVTRGTTKVWFATDRALAGNKTQGNIQKFKDGRGSGALSYGAAEVSFPASHRVGKVERPSFWKLQVSEDESKHVVIKECLVENFQDWKASATAHLDSAEEKSALVFIHGYNVKFDDALRRAAQIGFDISFEGLLTCFSWSSNGTKLGYLSDQDNADLAAPLLADFLRKLQTELKIKEVHIVAHSMGNRMLIAALKELSKTESKHLREVVMAAPDVDQDIFTAALAGLKQKARRYTIYGSDNDRALKLSKKMRAGHPRIGDGGNHVYVAAGVDTIDASQVPMVPLDPRHSYAFDNRSVLSDLHYVIRASTPAQKRSGLIQKLKDKLPYWQIAI